MGATGYVNASVVTEVNNETGDVTLDAADVGADATGTASTAVSAHAGATDPHGDRAYTDIGLSGKVATTLQVATTAPLTGGGNLSGNLTLGISVGATSATVSEGRAPWFHNAPMPISGRYVYTGYGANATTSPTLDQARYMPFPVWQGFTASSLLVEVTTLHASALIRLGLHTATAGGLPGALVTDYGTFSGAATGTVGPTGTSIVFADRTLYYLSATLQGGGGGTLALRASNYHDPLVMPSTLGVLATIISAYVQNGVSGALPDPAVPGDGNIAPRFMLLCA